ncbi:lysylphosphatidylglycerol synthase domain-containing protein [Halopseudomonas sp.]|uniref:lysylphosphatidylglycerol synthase domain-containing protein n=1 Tax=Halopseudomonas sp. TaxID=2901191 RepID=UPI0039E51F0A
MSNGDQSAAPSPRRPLWYWAKRILTWCFFIAVPVLLYYLARNVDWAEVISTLRDYPLSTLALGAVIALVSYATYSCFDLLGRAYTGHAMRIREVLPVTFVCYAFNLNMGAIVGGVALRYRLYSRYGLDVPTITRVMSLSMVTNWLGYILLAGGLFSLGSLKLPNSWEIGQTGLRLIGIALLLVAIGYLLACGLSTRRSWHIRGHEIVLPPLKFALLQAALGAANWSMMALLIFLLLPEGVFYPSILAILMVSSIAGVITHIPAGLGVIEVVFIALLQHQVPQSEIMAALVGYRALYFLFPLALACVVYLALERQAQTRQHDGSGAEPENS